MAAVYFKKITQTELIKDPSVLIRMLDAAGFPATLRKGDFAGLKIHFGEKGNMSHISPKLVRPLGQFLAAQKTRPFLFDTNTLYRGMRTNSVDHLTQAVRNGFNAAGIPLVIGDGLKGNDYIEVDITGLKHGRSYYLASVWKDIDYILCLSHFTMHMLAGFGASMKNLGMGFASRRGKLAQHCEIAPRIDNGRCTACGACARSCPAECIAKHDCAYRIDESLCVGCAQCISICPAGAVTIQWSSQSRLLQERMIEYAYAATRDKRCAYFNFCQYITAECDCMNKEEKGCIPDAGVLFSYDPVAVDKAAVDIICRAAGKDIIKEFHSGIEYTAQFSYAASIGLGSPEYTLIEL